MKEEQHLQREARKALSFSSEKPPTPILDTINYPIHMKNLSIQVRKQYLEYKSYLVISVFMKMQYLLIWRWGSLPYMSS